MAIAESDISVLIPTFRQPAMVRAAVLSALATGAGEILVSDDKSGDDTRAALADLADPRLQVHVQPVNLGLWPNHLWLVHRSTRPWVKILQHDDRIAPGGLAVMAAAADAAVAVISAIPIDCDLGTGALRRGFELDRPLRFTSRQYLRRLCVVGNELGTPSCTLFRRDTLITDAAVWRSEISADLLVNLMAASRGDVVLLPPGPVISGHHADQDSQRQGLTLFARRLRNTLDYLFRQSDPDLRAFGGVFGMVEAVGEIRLIAGRLARASWPGWRMVGDAAATLAVSAVRLRLRTLAFVPRMLRWKYGRRSGRRIDTIPGVPDGVTIAGPAGDPGRGDRMTDSQQ